AAVAARIDRPPAGADSAGSASRPDLLSLMMMRHCWLAFAAAVCAAAAPRVDKVEPPNWWTPHTYNPVQVLLTGSELKGASFSTTAVLWRRDRDGHRP